MYCESIKEVQQYVPSFFTVMWLEFWKLEIAGQGGSGRTMTQLGESENTAI